jgi:hypothetical protein
MHFRIGYETFSLWAPGLKPFASRKAFTGLKAGASTPSIGTRSRAVLLDPPLRQAQGRLYLLENREELGWGTGSLLSAASLSWFDSRHRSDSSSRWSSE